MAGKNVQGVVLTILSAVLWGLNPLFARTVYAGGGNAATLAFFRMFLGTGFMALVHLGLTRTGLGVTRAELKKLILCSVGYAATPVLLLSSYNYLPSGLCTTIHFVYPVLVIAGTILFCHEKVSRWKLLCCGLCAAGIVCFYTPGGEISAFGIGIAFVSGVTYAFYIVYISASGLLELPVYKVTAYLNLISAVLIGAFTALTHQAALPTTPVSIGVLLCFALVAAFASAAFQLGTKYVGPQSSSLLSTFEPLTSVVVGFLVYRESLTFRSVLGIVCILLSVILLSLLEHKAE
ncbi:MAG: DMT family transporter [Lawsonibacter sp.]|nr:DMT family transporter [Lawsonibacter sp.]